mgnify:FL=1
MFEHMEFEVIMRQMLEKVPNNLDKRQGSIIYDALAPAAAELAQMYIALEDTLNLAFASTSRDEYLEKRTMEMGLTRRQATKAKKNGFFYGISNTPIEVPLGTRFSIEDLNYVVDEKLSEGQYVLECETPGEAGNRPQGRLIPIDYVPGLVKAELTELLVPGEDTESDDALLQRYQLRVRQPTTSGNIYHFKQWALDVQGVGDAKIFPLWNGPGTVKVVIVDAKKQPATTYLINEVTNNIERNRPIGANVTVVSGKAKNINISATVQLAPDYTIQRAQAEFSELAERYLQDSAFKKSYVSYAQIGMLLLSTGVIDYTDLKVNNNTVNVALADEEIPVLGTVTLGV